MIAVPGDDGGRRSNASEDDGGQRRVRDAAGVGEGEGSLFVIADGGARRTTATRGRRRRRTTAAGGESEMRPEEGREREPDQGQRIDLRSDRSDLGLGIRNELFI